MWSTAGEITHSLGDQAEGTVGHLTTQSVRLTNRSVLGEAIEQQYDPDLPCSLIIVNIDDFTGLNERIGQPAGDEVLVSVGERLRSVASDDLLGRVGVDEFMVFQNGQNGRHLAHAIVEAVRPPISITAPVTDTAVSVTVSVGVALGPHHGSSLADLSRSALHAVARAKDAGGNRAQTSILRSLQAGEVMPASQQLAATVRELIGILSVDGQANAWIHDLVAAYEAARTGTRPEFLALGEMQFATAHPAALEQDITCRQLRERIRDLTLVLARSASV